MSDTVGKIMEAVEELSEARRREVLDYVESLRDQEERRAENGERDPSENPASGFYRKRRARVVGSEH